MTMNSRDDYRFVDIQLEEPALSQALGQKIMPQCGEDVNTMRFKDIVLIYEAVSERKAVLRRFLEKIPDGKDEIPADRAAISASYSIGFKADSYVSDIHTDLMSFIGQAFTAGSSRDDTHYHDRVWLSGDLTDIAGEMTGYSEYEDDVILLAYDRCGQNLFFRKDIISDYENAYEKFKDIVTTGNSRCVKYLKPFLSEIYKLLDIFSHLLIPANLYYKGMIHLEWEESDKYTGQSHTYVNTETENGHEWILNSGGPTPEDTEYKYTTDDLLIWNLGYTEYVHKGVCDEMFVSNTRDEDGFMTAYTHFNGRNVSRVFLTGGEVRLDLGGRSSDIKSIYCIFQAGYSSTYHKIKEQIKDESGNITDVVFEDIYEPEEDVNIVFRKKMTSTEYGFKLDITPAIQECRNKVGSLPVLDQIYMYAEQEWFSYEIEYSIIGFDVEFNKYRVSI